MQAALSASSTAPTVPMVPIDATDAGASDGTLRTLVQPHPALYTHPRLGLALSRQPAFQWLQRIGCREAERRCIHARPRTTTRAGVALLVGAFYSIAAHVPAHAIRDSGPAHDASLLLTLTLQLPPQPQEPSRHGVAACWLIQQDPPRA